MSGKSNQNLYFLHEKSCFAVFFQEWKRVKKYANQLFKSNISVDWNWCRTYLFFHECKRKQEIYPEFSTSCRNSYFLYWNFEDKKLFCGLFSRMNIWNEWKNPQFNFSSKIFFQMKWKSNQDMTPTFP